MKYIKKYEELKDIKTYFIHYNESWSDTKLLSVWELKYGDIEGNTVYVINLYDYIIDKDELTEINDKNERKFRRDQFEEIKKSIVYTSDDIQDCLNILPVLYDNIIYNL